jgi:hypothetical protein
MYLFRDTSNTVTHFVVQRERKNFKFPSFEQDERGREGINFGLSSGVRFERVFRYDLFLTVE